MFDLIKRIDVILTEVNLLVVCGGRHSLAFPQWGGHVCGEILV